MQFCSFPADPFHCGKSLVLFPFRKNMHTFDIYFFLQDGFYFFCRGQNKGIGYDQYGFSSGDLCYPVCKIL